MWVGWGEGLGVFHSLRWAPTLQTPTLLLAASGSGGANDCRAQADGRRAVSIPTSTAVGGQQLCYANANATVGPPGVLGTELWPPTTLLIDSRPMYMASS